MLLYKFRKRSHLARLAPDFVHLVLDLIERLLDTQTQPSELVFCLLVRLKSIFRLGRLQDGSNVSVHLALLYFSGLLVCSVELVPLLLTFTILLTIDKSLSFVLGNLHCIEI